MLLGHNFGFPGGYLAVTVRCLMVTTSYCSLPGGCCSLLVVTARYRSLLLVPTFSMNGSSVNLLHIFRTPLLEIDHFWRATSENNFQ